MNRIRRSAVLLGLTASVIVGSTIPASATFSDSVAVSPSLSTASVTRPAWASVEVTYCHPVFTFDATVRWPAGAAPRGVSGYRITAYLNNGTSAVVVETGSAARSYSTTFDRAYLQFQPRVTVSTLTTYGWTAESPRSAVISC